MLDAAARPRPLVRAVQAAALMPRSRTVAVRPSPIHASSPQTCRPRSWTIEARFGGGSACMANGSDFRKTEPNPKNRVAETIERRILELTVEQPAWGHTRMANELAKEGLRVSPTGVRGVLVRHDLN